MTEPNGRFLSVDEIVKLKNLPRRRNGKRLHKSTVVRWMKKGCKGIQLKCLAVGSSLYTTEPWLMEFFAACAPPLVPMPVRTRETRRVMTRRAVERELKKEGL